MSFLGWCFVCVHYSVLSPGGVVDSPPVSRAGDSHPCAPAPASVPFTLLPHAHQRQILSSVVGCVRLSLPRLGQTSVFLLYSRLTSFS